jgi:hypothetical protein
MNQPFKPLLLVQISTTGEHLISVTGCSNLQKDLLLKNRHLKLLRPSTTCLWVIVFIVPDDVEPGFLKQGFKVSKSTPDHEKQSKINNWLRKTTQYVLSFPVKKAMQGGHVNSQ